MKVSDFVGVVTLVTIGWFFLEHYNVATSACFFALACMLIPGYALKIIVKTILFAAFGYAAMLCYDWFSCISFIAAAAAMLELLQRQLNPRND